MLREPVESHVGGIGKNVGGGKNEYLCRQFVA